MDREGAARVTKTHHRGQFSKRGKGGLFAWIGICAVFANVEVLILVHAFGMDQTLGNTLFASSFLATDILSELYGKKDANKGVLVGIITTVMFIGVFTNLFHSLCSGFSTIP